MINIVQEKPLHLLAGVSVQHSRVKLVIPKEFSKGEESVAFFSLKLYGRILFGDPDLFFAPYFFYLPSFKPHFRHPNLTTLSGKVVQQQLYAFCF